VARVAQFGEKRCTLEGAELLVRIYQNAYARRARELSKAKLDAMSPPMLRVKTGIEEADALIATAKKKGASAWDRMKDPIQAALDRLTSNYRDAMRKGTK